MARMSGMTVRDWCTENDVPAPTMYLWVRRLREGHSAGQQRGARVR